jgi:hypothetical protein
MKQLLITITLALISVLSSAQKDALLYGDTLNFSATNLIWIIVESEQTEEVIEETKKLYNTTESWSINKLREHNSMWTSQVLCFKIDSNLTMICGWGIDSWSCPKDKTTLVVKSLSERFGKAKLYYCADGRTIFGWIGYENGMSTDSFLFQVATYGDVCSNAPILVDDQHQDSLEEKALACVRIGDDNQAMMMLVTNFKEHFPAAFPPFKVDKHGEYYYLNFEHVIESQVTLIVTTPHMRAHCYNIHVESE